MRFRSQIAWILGAILAAVGAYWLSTHAGPEAAQPINFSHKKHLTAKRGDEPITCKTCHKFYKTRQVSGRPGVKICAGCHSTTKPLSGEMEILRRYIDEKREIPWRRVYLMPNTVFYSHRTHIVSAKISCETCHGDVGGQEEALTRPLKVITMDSCIDCHRTTKIPDSRKSVNGKKKSVAHFVSTDCNACHK